MLTTAQAAQRLGVKPETIYAYVSRGMLTRTKVNRASMFDADEVEALSGGKPPSGTVERIRTRLTLLDNDTQYYRGRPVNELVTRNVEDVAHWLWTADLREHGPFEAPELTVPSVGRLTDHIRIAVALAGAADPLRFDLTPKSVVRTAETLLAQVVDSLPLRQEPTGRTLAERLWARLSAQPAQPGLLNAALVLLADHDLAVSTLAARVAASARAHVYAAVSAGLGAMDGQYHGGASTTAYRFLREAQDDPIAALSDRLRTGEAVPGFGQRIYQARDPRADLLLEMLREHGELVADRLEHPSSFPNVDLALAQMAQLFGMPPDAGEAVFAVARIIGWVAHALEEYQEPGLRFRAIGVYTGERP